MASLIVDVTETGKRPTQTRLPVEAIAPLIVGFLGAARSCASKTKSDGNPFEKEIGPAQELYVQANGVGLSDPPEKPELIAMTFAFGQTRLNIALSREVLQPLGTATCRDGGQNSLAIALELVMESAAPGCI
jgi:hypothetical protein